MTGSGRPGFLRASLHDRGSVIVAELALNSRCCWSATGARPGFSPAFSASAAARAGAGALLVLPLARRAGSRCGCRSASAHRWRSSFRPRSAPWRPPPSAARSTPRDPEKVGAAGRDRRRRSAASSRATRRSGCSSIVFVGVAWSSASACCSARTTGARRRVAERLFDEAYGFDHRPAVDADGHRRRAALQPADDLLRPADPSGGRRPRPVSRVLISIPGALGYIYAGWPAASRFPDVAALQLPFALGYISLIGALLVMPTSLAGRAARREGRAHHDSSRVMRSRDQPVRQHSRRPHRWRRRRADRLGRIKRRAAGAAWRR
jgi:hypothetical protein